MKGQKFPIDAIARASRNPAILDQMARCYSQVEREIERYQPACNNRGICCDFDHSGHRLFVTTLEAAYFVAYHSEDRGAERPRSGACPFSTGHSCTSRHGRPLGCRVYYCQAGTEGWQSEVTERYLMRLRRLHEGLGVEYVYGEWMALLDELRTAGLIVAPALCEIPNRMRHSAHDRTSEKLFDPVCVSLRVIG